MSWQALFVLKKDDLIHFTFICEQIDNFLQSKNHRNGKSGTIFEQNQGFQRVTGSAACPPPWAASFSAFRTSSGFKLDFRRSAAVPASRRPACMARR